ncbi:MAG: hypothetical protein OZ914_00715 [Anaerolineaceae bacterium]|jgi:hypothetical protein|nr:hypothetical protein [Anaerolineaceae bacterium]OQY91114.1 MAG: hypothetical protein B6D38_00510 [Anaerolineae bacterium UTCFX1]
MKRLLLALGFLISACSSANAPQGFAQSLPTALIDPSYPTVQAAPVAPAQSSDGLNVSAARAWRDGKDVNVEICFTLVDSSDWSIWSASLQYGETAVFDFASAMLSLQEPREGQLGLRCDTLSFFNIPPDADLSNAIITVDAIAAVPRPEDYCTIYAPKIQQTLDARDAGIVLICTDADGAPMVQIVDKPESMSQQEAESIVFSDEFYTIRGPWSFAFNLEQ